jgi:hypothetical protein
MGSVELDKSMNCMVAGAHAWLGVKLKLAIVVCRSKAVPELLFFSGLLVAAYPLVVIAGSCAYIFPLREKINDRKMQYLFMGKMIKRYRMLQQKYSFSKFSRLLSW